MSLTEMSVSGGALILAVIVIRALALHRLPKRVFRILWGIALLRLLMPFSIPSPLSVYTLAEPLETIETPAQREPAVIPAAPAYAADGRTTAPQIPVRQMVWGTGALLCAAFFMVSYVRGRRRFSASHPAEQAAAWLAAHRLRRKLSVRQCAAVSAPLTYGILRPVILVPAAMDWTDTEQTAYVLEHEFVHIQRFDAAAKLVLAAALCVHWFNPLVWAMYVLANQDIELSCDETVVRRFGLGKKSAYAMTLISMEEQKSSLPPMASCFSRNAIEERIRAIMKIRKTSALAVLLAAVLVCGVSVGFATSAAEPGDLQGYLKKLPYPDFTEEESQWLLSLWIDGYEDMTVAEYQKEMWAGRDTPEAIELLDRYAQCAVWETGKTVYIDDEKANEAADAFRNYYINVYEPLTAERWQTREFSSHAMFDGLKEHRLDAPDSPALNALLEYTCTLNIFDADKLTVGEYEQARQDVKDTMASLLWERTAEELKNETYMQTFLDREIETLEQRLSTDSLQIQISGYSFVPMDTDEQLYRQSSEDTRRQWDEQLAPYTAFGLTYEFDDPDLDGNGLKMYYQGHEVRGIVDRDVWITEHSGNGSFSPDAIELYTEYKGGRLSGLRPATAEEQAEWDTKRRQETDTAPGPYRYSGEEKREFPNGTEEDYASYLELMQWEPDGLPEYASYPYFDYQDMTLEEFNARLLEWANGNPDAYDRIMCDVIWDDYAVELTGEEKQFVSLTSNLSGTENGVHLRSRYTGQTEEDPSFSVQFPERTRSENGITTAWADLYYVCSYHVSDKSVVTVRERDRCTGGVMTEIRKFWEETSLDTLLGMTEAQIVDRLNQITAGNSTEQVTIQPITADDIHFEAAEEYIAE